MLFKCKNIFKKIFLIGLLIPCLQLYASGDLTIEGFVTNANTGDPLPGANVIIVGSNVGSSTDLDGKYTIKRLSPGSYVFRVTYIGYETTEKTVAITSGEQKRVNFTLAKSGPTSLIIYNALGQEVQTVIDNKIKSSGPHKLSIDMSEHSSGIYYYVLKQNNNRQVNKMVLIK
jgi:hypothetical protein